MLVKSAASAQKVAEAQVQFFFIIFIQTWTANLKPSPKSYVTQYVDIHCSQ